MDTDIRYPIGIQTFPKLREGGYLYVDKTELIYDMVHRFSYVFLSRPRRFGKSLLVSTIESYFQGRSELFEGLAMERLEREWKKYPVIRIDMSGENFKDTERLVSYLHSRLDSVERKLGITTSGSPAQRFSALLEMAHEKYGQRVVVLIDEYDKPLLESLHDEMLHTSMKDELRSFYTVLKMSDEYIRFVMITGVSKFGKVSIFSGLNNLKDISMLPRFNAICGISESELRKYFKLSITVFSEDNEISEDEAWREIKAYYDGYHFAERGEYIYNPFSVLNAFDENRLKEFWFATGSSDYLVKLITRNHYPLMNLEGIRRNERELSDIRSMDEDIVPLLFQAGYLTIKNYDGQNFEYTLGFPNREVYQGFWQSLSRYFFSGYGGSQGFDVGKFVADVNEGRADQFMRRLKTLFDDTESFPETKKEIHFQNMMATACKMMGLKVYTEIRSPRGRCDMQIHTARYVYIIEIKVDESAAAAMAQIKEKGYADPFALDPREVWLIGADFSTETRTLTDWLIEKV